MKEVVRSLDGEGASAHATGYTPHGLFSLKLETFTSSSLEAHESLMLVLSNHVASF